jgi:hypothetical protein
MPNNQELPEDVREKKNQVAISKGYPSWDEMENFIIDHSQPVVVAQLLVSAMEEVYSLAQSEITRLKKWTGLMDKNNKPVYLGDILQGKDKRWLIEEIGEDMDGNGWGYCWSPNGNGVRYPINCREIKTCEVVGNIYDQPQLLNIGLINKNLSHE